MSEEINKAFDELIASFDKAPKVKRVQCGVLSTKLVTEPIDDFVKRVAREAIEAGFNLGISKNAQALHEISILCEHGDNAQDIVDGCVEIASEFSVSFPEKVDTRYAE